VRLSLFLVNAARFIIIISYKQPSCVPGDTFDTMKYITQLAFEAPDLMPAALFLPLGRRGSVLASS